MIIIMQMIITKKKSFEGKLAEKNTNCNNGGNGKSNDGNSMLLVIFKFVFFYLYKLSLVNNNKKQ